MRVPRFLYLGYTCILLFLVKPVFSTPPPADSLLRALQRHAVRDTARVKLLNQLGRAYFNRDADLVTAYAKEALRLSDSLHYTEGRILASRNLALVENTKGNLDKQMDMTLASLALAEKAGLQHLAGILNNDIGNILIEQNNPAQALRYLKKSLLIKQQFHEQPEIAKSLNNIGSCYMQLDQLDSALCYLEASEEVKLPLHDLQGLGFTYENMGLIYLKKSMYQVSLKYLEQSQACFRTADYPPGIGKSWLNLAKVNTLLKRYDTAAVQLQEAARHQRRHEECPQRNDLLPVPGPAGFLPA